MAEVISNIYSVVVITGILFIIGFSIYVDNRRLKSVKKLEQSAKRLDAMVESGEVVIRSDAYVEKIAKELNEKMKRKGRTPGID